MRIKVDPSVLRETRWNDYAVRFLLGGLITAGTGLVAKEFGTVIGGLFLAFPAILPASATLIEKHERERKEKHGLRGSAQARKAASVDAAGASLGSLGLLAFAFVAWRLLGREKTWLALTIATAAWTIVSLVAWLIRKRI